MNFPAFKNKKEVAEFLAKGYRESGCYALSNVNIPKLATWANTFYECLRYPVQPKIDVLWYDPSKDELNGIRIEYFREIPWTDELIPPYYYAGVGEALAMLNYGLDYAWLFHVFDGNMNKQAAELASNSAAKILTFTPIAYMAIIHNEAKMLTAKVYNPALEKNIELRKSKEALIEGLKRSAPT
ncbi:MAG: hypothetical protein ACUVRA_09390 [Candidatus Bathyarchaeaceae archaeon]